MWASEFQASQFLQVWNFEVVLARAQPVPSRSARAQTQISVFQKRHVSIQFFYNISDLGFELAKVRNWG